MLTLWACSASAATIQVTTSADELNADGDCSLREAVQAANTNARVDACAAGDTVDDVVLLAAIAGQTIDLTLGQIEVTDGVTISQSSGRAVIDADDTGRIFLLSLTSPVEPVTLVGLTLRDGNGSVGGAVFVADGQPVMFTGVTFNSNTSAGSGGAVRVGTGAHWFVGVEFNSNSTTAAGMTDGGGALYNDGGDVRLSGNAFISNTALAGSASGGAVLNGFGGTLRGSGTFLSNQAARTGGAIESSGDLFMDGLFSRNTAGVSGGAVHLTGAVTATFAGRALFFSNMAGTEGGAVWNSATGTLNMTNAEITGNTAAGPGADQGGGGVFSDGGTTTLTTVTMTNNHATGAEGSGGGIQNTAGGRLTISGGMISNNTAVRAGGGVHITGAAVVTITGGRLQGNFAAEGGGLWKAGAATVSLTGTIVSGNEASGAMADQGGGGIYNDGAGGTLTLTSLTVSGNRALGTAGSGGGLFNNTGATTLVDRVTFSENFAARAGGAIEDNAGALLRLTGAFVTRNSAVAFLGAFPGYGGGVHVTGAGTVEVVGSTFSSNGGVQGGALWNSGSGTMTVTETTIRDNSAISGAGIYQQAGTTGTLRVERSLIAANSASRTTGMGGGVLVAGGRLVRIVNSTVSGNSAESGAGVAVTEAGVVAIESSTVANNVALTAGGGLLSPSARQLSLANTLVADNAASAGADCSGSVTTTGVNLVETAGCTVTGPAPIAADPALSALSSNGGPTFTHAIGASSVAATAGSTALTVDQRRFARSAPASIGAFEFGGMLVAGENAPVAQAAFDLSPASPNPARSATTLRVRVATSERVEVALYDALGRHLRRLYAGTPAAESTVDVRVDVADLAPGVYVVRATGSSAAATQRITVVR